MLLYRKLTLVFIRYLKLTRNGRGISVEQRKLTRTRSLNCEIQEIRQIRRSRILSRKSMLIVQRHFRPNTMNRVLKAILRTTINLCAIYQKIGICQTKKAAVYKTGFSQGQD